MKNPDDGDDGAHKFDVSGLCSDDDCSSNSDLRQSDHSLACQAQIPKRYTTHLNENLSGDAPSASDNIQTRVTGLGHGTTSHVPILNQIPKALTGSSQSSPAPSSPNERVGPRTAFAQDVLADSGSRKPEPVRSPEIVTKNRSNRATNGHKAGGTASNPTDSPTSRGSNIQHVPSTEAKSFETKAYPKGKSAWCQCCWALVVVAAIGLLAFICTSRFPLISSQAIVHFIAQATAYTSSVYAGLHYAMRQVDQNLAAMFYAPCNSTRVELGHGLNNVYFSLSQILATSNSLYKVPGLVSKRRTEAMKFEVPKDSLISDPLQLFLQQSLHVDEHLLAVVLKAGQLSTLALRQQQWTENVVEAIQLTEYWYGGVFGIALLGKRTQEELLYRRLKEHVELLSNATTELDEVTRKVLGEFVKLTHTTEDIYQACVDDKQRLLRIKAETASERNWLVRAAIGCLPLDKPEGLARISKNVALAGGINEWALEVVKWLEQMTTGLRYALEYLGALMQIIRKHNTIRWSAENKNYELEKFLGQVNVGVMLLKYNNDARS